MVAKEADARSAALVHADVQAVLKSVHVITLRPVPVSLAAAVARSGDKPDNFINAVKEEIIGMREWAQTVCPDDLYNRWEETTFAYFGLAVIKGVIQARDEQFRKLIEYIEHINEYRDYPSISPPRKILKEDLEYDPDIETLIKFFGHPASFDPTERDRQQGICPVPIYDFSPLDFEVLRASDDIEEVKVVFRKHDLLQYFFPAADHLALGLADRSRTKTVVELRDRVLMAPEMGHPFGSPEIAEGISSVAEIIDELQKRKLLVEGEIGLSISKEGQVLRKEIRFKPRESFVSKLLNRFRFDISLRDLFRPGDTG